MTIISIKSGTDEELRKIELSDGSSYTFKTCYLPPVFADEDFFAPGSAEGRPLSGAEEDGFRSASACLRAEKAALQLIARAEQSVFGLTRKLKKRRHDPACIQAVIARLCELELLDDRRYARLWLESRINRQASSPWRLLTALRSRGIDRNDADSALKEVLGDEAEFQLLLRYAEKLNRKHERIRTRDHTAKTGEQESAAAGRRCDTQALKYQLKSEGFSTSAIQRFFEE